MTICLVIFEAKEKSVGLSDRSYNSSFEFL